MTLRTRIAACLYRARKRSNKTRPELALILGCHENTILNVEAAKVGADRWADAWLEACQASVMVTLGPVPSMGDRPYELRRIRALARQEPTE